MSYKEFINAICTNDAVIEAVSVGVTLYNWLRGASQDAIDSGRIARRWWESHGRTYATILALLLLLIACATVASVRAVYWWLRDYGVPGGLQGLDALCCFLLCYEGQACEAKKASPQRSSRIDTAVVNELWDGLGR